MAGKSLGLLALAAILTTAGAFAADPPAPAGKQQLICRGGGERQLGSHVRTRRRCLTAEQWQQEDEAKASLPVSLQVTQGQNDGQTVRAPQ
ncbi:MAG: hypothetical protein QOD42_141 [Sphingomonadales bacterium]|jgi:hypothetical protein|nr:hypothetical protein [Sphingomonadales bacterium]